MAIKTHKVTLSLDNPRVIQSGINVQSFDKQSIQISIELTKNDEVFQVPSDATIRVSLLKLARQEQKIIVDVPNTNRDSIDWIVPDYLDGYQGTVRVGVYLVSGTENVDLGYFTILSNVSDIDKMADEFTDDVFQGWERIEADLNELNLTIAQTKLDLVDDLTQIDNTITNINAKNTQVNTLASNFADNVATKQSDVTSKYNAFDTSVTQAGQTIDDILALQPQFQAVLDETTGKDVISAPEIIVGRGGYATLGERLDSEKAELEDLSYTVLNAIETSEKKLVNGLKEGFDDLYLPNGKGRLKLPLYYTADDHQTTHPSVLFFADGYLGYKFWMGYTPYTNGNEVLENPCVAVSEDGFVWKVFDGMINPLARTEDVTTNHYSDTHLVKSGDTLECWYRHSFRGNVQQEIEHICRRTTVNGKDWTPEEVLFTRYNSLDQTLCPVVHFVNGVYKIWVVNYPSDCLDYFETSTGANWQLIRQIPMPTHDEDFKVWHMDILETNGLYEMYYNGGNNRHLTTSMCYATSTDNQTYIFESEIFKSMPENFDEKDVYRPSVFDVGGDRWMFYGGESYYGHWGIGLTIGKKDNPTVFKGIELSTRASYFKGEYTGHVFSSGIHTPSVRVGELSELNEKEMKFTKKEVSDVVIGLSPHFNDILQVQNTFKAKTYTGILMHRLHLWDAPNETPKYYLSVEDGKLRFFDGTYHQFVSVPLYADANERPTNPKNGDMVFAKELGKPIWYHDGRWVDAMGTTV